ncbi:hypothetical protein L195_g015113, partial [Trifolium pratense]
VGDAYQLWSNKIMNLVVFIVKLWEKLHNYSTTLKGCSISGFLAHIEGITVSLSSISDLASSNLLMSYTTARTAASFSVCMYMLQFVRKVVPLV